MPVSALSLSTILPFSTAGQRYKICKACILDAFAGKFSFGCIEKKGNGERLKMGGKRSYLLAFIGQYTAVCSWCRGALMVTMGGWVFGSIGVGLVNIPPCTAVWCGLS